jgi:hypothetical protein
MKAFASRLIQVLDLRREHLTDAVIDDSHAGSHAKHAFRRGRSVQYLLCLLLNFFEQLHNFIVKPPKFIPRDKSARVESPPTSNGKF